MQGMLYAVHLALGGALQLRRSQWSKKNKVGSTRWEPQEKVKEFGKRILIHMEHHSNSKITRQA